MGIYVLTVYELHNALFIMMTKSGRPYGVDTLLNGKYDAPMKKKHGFLRIIPSYEDYGGPECPFKTI